jgi:hypothetical protein
MHLIRVPRSWLECLTEHLSITPAQPIGNHPVPSPPVCWWRESTLSAPFSLLPSHLDHLARWHHHCFCNAFPFPLISSIASLPSSTCLAWMSPCWTQRIWKSSDQRPCDPTPPTHPHRWQYLRPSISSLWVLGVSELFFRFQITLRRNLQNVKLTIFKFKVCGIWYIHKVVLPPPLSSSKAFLSLWKCQGLEGYMVRPEAPSKTWDPRTFMDKG